MIQSRTVKGDLLKTDTTKFLPSICTFSYHCVPLSNIPLSCFYPRIHLWIWSQLTQDRELQYLHRQLLLVQHRQERATNHTWTWYIISGGIKYLWGNFWVGLNFLLAEDRRNGDGDGNGSWEWWWSPTFSWSSCGVPLSSSAVLFQGVAAPTGWWEDLLLAAFLLFHSHFVCSWRTDKIRQKISRKSVSEEKSCIWKGSFIYHTWTKFSYHALPCFCILGFISPPLT